MREASIMDAYIPTLIGCLLMGLPSVLLAWIALRRDRAIFWFAVALIFVGLGYLAKLVMGKQI
jgi:hypothetical protein